MTHNVSTHGQSDIRVGSNLQISRVEPLHSTLGSFEFKKLFGFNDGTFNTLLSEGHTFVIAGDNKTTAPVAQTLSTEGGVSIAPYKLLNASLNNLSTQLGSVSTYEKTSYSQGNTHSLSSAFYFSYSVERVTTSLNTVSTTGVVTFVVLDLTASSRVATTVSV